MMVESGHKQRDSAAADIHTTEGQQRETKPEHVAFLRQKTNMGTPHAVLVS